MKYVIDIDGTICEKYNGIYNDGDYSTNVPIQSRIQAINKLFEEGHIIEYFTARGMGRFCNDAVKANEMFYEFTENQLKSWGCKYHRLILGKPSGDVYVDDKGVNANDFFSG